ncbi:MAG: VCBS repeat-containing protein [bacterium]
MIKRIVTFLFILFALFYTALGIYFYNKSHKKKIVAVVDKIKETKFLSSELVPLKELIFDFEEGHQSNGQSINGSKSFSGKKSLKVNSASEYGPEIKIPFSEIPSMKNFRRLEVSLKVWNEKPVPDNLWVVEVDGENGSVLSWHAEGVPVTSNQWDSITLSIDIKPEFLKNFNHIKTYAWNRNKNTFYADDIKLVFLGVQSDEQLALTKPLNQTTFFYDLENDSLLEETETLSSDFSHSGKYSSLIKGKEDYSVTISKQVGDVMNDTIRAVWLSVWLYPLNDNPDCTLSMEIRNSDDESIYWNGKSTAAMNLKANEWQKINAVLSISPDDLQKINPTDRIYVYVVSNGRKKIYVDDFTITIGDMPETRGEQTYVDMNASGGNYEFSSTHPPYKIGNLIYSDIHNNNSSFLIDKDSIRTGQILPDQVMLTGNFSGKSQGNDELLVISDSSISIFNYCNKSSSFILSGTIPFPNNKSQGNKYLAADLNGDGKVELITINNKFSTIYNFILNDFKYCQNIFKEMKMNLLYQGDIISNGIKLFAAKFSGKNYDELFSINKKGEWKIFRLTGKGLNIEASGNLDTTYFGNKSTQVCGKISSVSKDELLSVYNFNNQTKFILLELNKGVMEIKKLNQRQRSSDIFDWNSRLSTISTGLNKRDNIFSFNHNWRFEIKVISFDKDELFISSTPEFKGYDLDRNPKYYEYPKLIPGNFTGTNYNLLCVLYNCLDKKFDGVHCSNFENLSNLPNAVQLYNFSK